MVFVGNKKYACETCIKGHRSSTCKHIDRPLFEIKKKGRPVTQCEHCRELRKTKQLHVKCICAHKDSDPFPSESAGPSSPGQGSSKVPASAAFPSGLPPEVLEASVALQSALSDSSDSEHSHASPALCNCDNSAECTGKCVASRPKGKGRAHPRRGSSKQTPSPHSPREPPAAGPAGIVASAHAAGHRPVLPRPPPPEQQSSFRPAHNPSTTTTSYSSGSRHHSHGQLYSPYGRIYESMNAGDAYGHRLDIQPISRQSQPIAVDHSRTRVDLSAALPDFHQWSSFSAVSPSASESILANISLCACGPSCTCPGCFEHRGQDAVPNAMCANPNLCMACIECFADPLPLAPNDPRLVYPDSQAQNVDEWLRQVNSAEPPTATSAPSLSTFAPSRTPPLQAPRSRNPHPSQPQVPSLLAAHTQTQSQVELDMPYDPTLLQTYALWNDLHDARASSRPAQGEWGADPDVSGLGHSGAEVESECCAGRCQCKLGMCACPPECYGCCQTCECEGGVCQRTIDSGRRTFSVSGERLVPSSSLSVLGPERTAGGSIVQPRPVADPWAMQGQGASDESNVVDWTAQTLDVPRVTLSRASSHSSQSSAGRSYSSTSSLGSALVMPSPSASGSGRSSCCSSRRSDGP